MQPRRSVSRFLAVCLFGGLVSCSKDADRTRPTSELTVRVGVAQLAINQPTEGLRQISQLFSAEGLVRPAVDGRLLPQIAESLTPSSDGRTLTVQLKPSVQFHDGSPLDASTVAAALTDSLRSYMGPVFAEIDRIESTGQRQIAIHFKRSSVLLREALEAPLQKVGQVPVSTGPYSVVRGSTTDMESNKSYYLGRPLIDRISVENYPNVRAAWADLLRERIDVLYEVGPDAMDSMKDSKTASLFMITRPFQHVIVFNPAARQLTAKVRRALSYAIDRPTIVQQGLRSYGVPSEGPLWTKYWAVPPDMHGFTYDPKRAVELLGPSKQPLRFVCLVAPDSIDERIALEVKRQLAAIGVDMNVEGVSREEIFKRASSGDFEAAAVERISGPTAFRPYLVWHSNAPFNFGKFGSQTLDAALDRMKEASDEASMRSAVLGVHQAFMDDPPAIFLAWSVRARAVSNRFVIPPLEPGRDVLATLRLWRPSADNRYASRN